MNPFALTVLMYHYVRDANDAAESGSGIPGMAVSGFEAQMDALASHYAMVSWLEVKKYLLGDGQLADRACLLTFDDGVCDHYINVYPALRKRGLSGLFFALARNPAAGLALGHKIHFLLPRLGLANLREAFWEQLDAAGRMLFRLAEAKYQAEFPGEPDLGDIDVFKRILQRDLSDRAETILSLLIADYIGSETELADHFYLSSNQIAEMAADGMHFGGHSQTHPWFDWIGTDQQAKEIEASETWLATFAASPWGFAYPYGGLHSQSISLLRAHGFIAAFTTIPRAIHTDPFLIGRFDAESFIPEMTRPGFSAGST